MSVFFKGAFRLFLIAVLCLPVLAALLLLALYLKPLSLPWAVRPIEFNGVKLEYKTVDLRFSAGLHLRAKNARVSTTGTGQQTAALREIDVRFSMPRLFIGAIAPTEIRADGLSLNCELHDEGLTIAGMPAPQEKERQRPEPLPDIPKILDKLYSWRAARLFGFQALRRIWLTNSQITFRDSIRRQEWQAVDLKIDLAGGRKEELAVAAAAVLKKGGTQAIFPVLLRLHHAFGSDRVNADIIVDINELQALSPYIPAPWAQSFAGGMKLRFGAAVTSTGLFGPLVLEADSGEARVSLPELFSRPLSLKRLSVRGEYTHHESAPDLFLRDFLLQDQHGTEFAGSARVSDVGGNAHVSLDVRVSPTTIDHLTNYVPDAAVPGLAEWLGRNLNSALIRSAVFHAHGPLSEVPFAIPSPQSALSAAFDFTGLAVNFWERMPPGTALSGSFRMDRGAITITAAEGALGEQRVEGLQVHIADVASPGRPIMLSVKGKAAGPAADVLSWFMKHDAAAPLISLSGVQESDVQVALPLQGPVSMKNLHLHVNSRIKDLQGKSPDHQLSFAAREATVAINGSKLEFQSRGALNGEPADAAVTEDLSEPGARTELRVHAVLTDDVLARIAGSERISARGKAAVAVQAVARDKGKYAVDSELDLTQASINVPDLGYQKTPGSPGRLTARCLVLSGSEPVAVEMLSASAPGLRLEASGQLLLNPLRATSVVVSQLKVGESQLSGRWTEGRFEISGRQLDLRSYAHKRGKEGAVDETPGTPLKARIELDRLLLSGGGFTKFRAELAKGGSSWEQLKIAALTGNSSEASAVLAQEEGAPVLRIQSADAPALLRLANVKGRFEGGAITARIVFPPGQALNLKAGAKGVITIRDISVSESPLLFQLLSLFSVQEWLSSNKGVFFQKIRMPVTMSGDAVTLEEVKLEGPLLTVYMSGTVSLASGELNLSGNAVPLRAMGRIAETMGIVGRTVSDIQKKFVGVPFRVTGTRDNPVVTSLGVDISGSR